VARESRGSAHLAVGLSPVGLIDRMARPGDQVRLEAELLRLRSSFGKGRLAATINGEVAAEGELTFGIIDRPAELG